MHQMDVGILESFHTLVYWRGRLGTIRLESCTPWMQLETQTIWFWSDRPMAVQLLFSANKPWLSARFSQPVMSPLYQHGWKIVMRCILPSVEIQVYGKYCISPSLANSQGSSALNTS